MRAPSPSFKTTSAECDLIGQIADRAEQRGLIHKGYSRMTAVMDLTACHANGCPLDFAGLLAAEPLDFTHDICGIARHMNRETGKLGGCFLPRCAARETA